MTVWQTIGVYVLIPLGLFAVLAAFTLRPKAVRGQRYRPGSGWVHEPVWWTADPAGAGRSVPVEVNPAPGSAASTAATASTARGGASGNW